MTALDVPLITSLSHANQASPLEDDELVDRRSRHRRAVRQIPAWIVNSVAGDANLSTVAPMRDHPDRVLMEMHLRDVADRLLGQLRLTLDDLATATLSALIATVAWADELAGDYRDPRIDG